MEKFIKGDIVVIPFPFSNLTQAKRRPALVLAQLDGNDLVLCQITSQHLRDRYSIRLSSRDFLSGNLKKQSNIRPNRLFTADKQLILYRIGHLQREKLNEVVEKIIQILRQ